MDVGTGGTPTTFQRLGQARSHGVAWGGKCHPWSVGWHLFATPGNFLAILYSCVIFVAKEKCPEILVELKFDLSDMLKSPIASYIYSVHLIVIT